MQWTLSDECQSHTFLDLRMEPDAFPHSNPLSLVIWTAQPNLKFLWGNTQLSNGRLRKNLASASNGNTRTCFVKLESLSLKPFTITKQIPATRANKSSSPPL